MKKSFFDKLNLRPQERRLVVVVGVIVFIVLNMLFVWPHFGEGKVLQNKILQAKKNQQKFQTEIARVPQYQSKLQELVSAGSEVASEEQAYNLQSLILKAAQATGVIIRNSQPTAAGGLRKQDFFDEYGRTISLETGDKELVDFLVHLASSSSIIRVKSLSLRPDTSQTKLVSSIVLVASYQKKPDKPAAVSAADKARRPEPKAGSKPSSKPSALPNPSKKS